MLLAAEHHQGYCEREASINSAATLCLERSMCGCFHAAHLHLTSFTSVAVSRLPSGCLIPDHVQHEAPSLASSTPWTGWVSSVERQIFQMSIASSAGTMRDTVVNTATNDYDAIVVVAVATIKVMGAVYSPGRAATSFNVCSRDLDDGISYFSNFGSCVDPLYVQG